MSHISLSPPPDFNATLLQLAKYANSKYLQVKYWHKDIRYDIPKIFICLRYRGGVPDWDYVLGFFVCEKGIQAWDFATDPAIQKVDFLTIKDATKLIDSNILTVFVNSV